MSKQADNPTTADNLMLIEAEGILYRGPAPDLASEVWDYPRKRWEPYYACRLGQVHGRRIDEAEAETLKFENPHAEHYMYYDVPPWIGAPWSDEYRKAVFPESLWSAIVEARAKNPNGRRGAVRCVHAMGFEICPTCGASE